MPRKAWFDPSPPTEQGDDEKPLSQKLGWFAGLMLAGVIVVAGTAYLLRRLLFL